MTPEQQERCSRVITDTRLRAGPRLLYCALDDSGWQLSATVLARQIGTAGRTVMRWLRDLERFGYIARRCRMSKENAVNLLRDKKVFPNYEYGLDGGRLKCAWCGVQTCVLEQHHYPVAEKDGGTETVDICANCHREYHFLTDEGIFPADAKPEIFSQE